MKREIVLIVLLLLPMATALSSDQNTILPTSSLWKFDLFVEKITIFFTPSDAKAELYLLYAQERTEELRELGTLLDSMTFQVVESKWSDLISSAESLGADSGIERTRHSIILKEIQEKVSSTVADHIKKSMMPEVDLS